MTGNYYGIPADIEANRTGKTTLGGIPYVLGYSTDAPRVYLFDGVTMGGRALAWLADIGTAAGKNLGTSVNDPGTGKLEIMVPIQGAVTGASKAFAAGDCGKYWLRSNSGSAMTDTLPAGSGSTFEITIHNADASASDTVTVTGGGTINGNSSYVMTFGRRATFVPDGSGNWRSWISDNSNVFKSGDTMSGALGLPDGAVGSPALHGATSTTTGLYFDANDVLFTINGVLFAQIGSALPQFQLFRNGGNPQLALVRTDSSTGTQATISLQGTNSSAATKTFGSISGIGDTVTAGSEEAHTVLSVIHAGANTSVADANGTALNLRSGIALTMGGNGTSGSGTTVIDSNRIVYPHSYTIATLPSAVAGALIYVSDLGGGGGLMSSDGTNWKRANQDSIANVSTATGTITATPLTSAPIQRLTASLSGNLTLSMSSTNVWTGAKFRWVDATTRNGHTIIFDSSGGTKTVGTGQWIEFEYDGSAWQETAAGTLI